MKILYKNRPAPVVIAYDISDNKNRSKIHRILKEWRLDGQKSVHECKLTGQQAEELFLQLSEITDTKTDNLLMIWIERRRKILTRGCGGKTSMFKKIWVVK